MKKIFFGIYLLLLAFFSPVYAGGGITHMLVAQEAINRLPDPQLRQLLLNNLDAYLVGADYPDSGYIEGNHYGEDSHWDPFIYTFADYIKEKYPDPAIQNPKLVAFLFGCAAHRVSDEIMHWTFYPIVAEKDFNGDVNKAHSYADTGIDLLLNVDKNQWFTEPKVWWVPVSDLVGVYHRMGKDEYTAKEIIWGNSVLALANYSERLIAAPAYPYLKWKMPWTTANYADWPVGGLTMDEQKIAEYQTTLWRYLHKPSLRFMADVKITPEKTTPVTAFASQALASGAANVTTKTNADGSVELQTPVIRQTEAFQALLRQLLAKMTS